MPERQLPWRAFARAGVPGGNLAFEIGSSLPQFLTWAGFEARILCRREEKQQ
jgi:hypothetical protein